RNSNAGVAYGELQFHAWRGGCEPLDLDIYLTMCRELDCIAGKVSDDLAQTTRIAYDQLWNCGVNRYRELNTLGVRLNSEHPGCILHRCAHIHFQKLKLEPTCFNLRKIKY